MNKMIYVAGPMSGPDKVAEHGNVMDGMFFASRLMLKGWQPFIPHLSWYMDLFYPQPYERWMELDFEMIRRCGALYKIASSPGADREQAFAVSLGIPVYLTVNDVPDLTKNGKE